MKKKNKRIAIITILIIVVIAMLILSTIFLRNKDSKNLTTDIKKYEEYIGENGKYKEVNQVYNDIFPDTIPDTARIEDFCYYYYNPWDPCYLGYLVYTCDEKEYQMEYERLKKIQSSEDKYVYGAKEFPYKLCAVYTDPKNSRRIQRFFRQKLQICKRERLQKVYY